MGITSVLFLMFGWIFSVKGLIITALSLSSFFALCLSMCLFFWYFFKNKERFLYVGKYHSVCGFDFIYCKVGKGILNKMGKYENMYLLNIVNK